MANILKQAWRMLLLRGIVAILIGLLMLFAPGLTLATGGISFGLLFGIYALVDGISTLVGAISRREGQWVLLLIFGIIGVIAGLAVLANPLLFAVLTVTIVLYIFAFKAIAGGIVEVISAWRLRQEIDNEWLLALNGILAVVFGIILIARPISALEVLVLFTAFYLLISGVMLVILAFRMRSWSNHLRTPIPA